MLHSLWPTLGLGLLLASRPGHADQVDGPSARLQPPRPTPHIYGGAQVGTCGWPSAVQLTARDVDSTVLCSGTLVAPGIVIYAAHCGANVQSIAFGEDSKVPQVLLTPASCHLYPGHLPGNGTDFAFCQLAAADLAQLQGLPIVPILMGCETAALRPGRAATLVGFGLDSRQNLGMKQAVDTSIQRLVNNKAFIGGGGRDTCQGDSGGPAFLQLEDADGLPGLADGGWRAFGITSYGLGNTCGGGGYSSLMHLAVPWIEATSGVDITPCHDADGTWHPDARCGAFPAAAQRPLGSWSNSCAGGSATGLAASCGDSWQPPAFNLQLDLPAPGSTLDTELPLTLGIAATGVDLASLLFHITFRGQPLAPAPVPTAQRLRASTSTSAARRYFGPLSQLQLGDQLLVISATDARGATHSETRELTLSNLSASQAAGCAGQLPNGAAPALLLAAWRRRRQQQRRVSLLVLGLALTACDDSGRFARLDLTTNPGLGSTEGAVASQPAPPLVNSLSGAIPGTGVAVQESLFTYSEDAGTVAMLVFITTGHGYCSNLQAEQDRANLAYLALELVDTAATQDGPLSGVFKVVLPSARPSSGRYALVRAVNNDGRCANQLATSASQARAGSITLQSRISRSGGYTLGSLEQVSFAGQAAPLSGTFTALGCALRTNSLPTNRSCVP